MKIRTVIGLTGATAASMVGIAGLAAGPAGAGGNGGINMPADQLSAFLGAGSGFGIPALPVPVFSSPLLSGDSFPNTKVSGNCDDPSVAGLMNNIIGLDFQGPTGNAVVYKGYNGNVAFPFLPDGINAEGTATIDIIDPSTFTVTPTGYSGRAHIWFGQGANANGQSVWAETVSFSGADGNSTISFTTNPGSTQPASGKPGNHWGQENLNCNIQPGG